MNPTIGTGPGAVACAALLASTLCAQQAGGNIDDFFRGFIAEWIRFSPDLATSTGI